MNIYYFINQIKNACVAYFSIIMVIGGVANCTSHVQTPEHLRIFINELAEPPGTCRSKSYFAQSNFKYFLSFSPSGGRQQVKSQERYSLVVFSRGVQWFLVLRAILTLYVPDFRFLRNSIQFERHCYIRTASVVEKCTFRISESQKSGVPLRDIKQNVVEQVYFDRDFAWNIKSVHVNRNFKPTEIEVKSSDCIQGL